MWQCLRPVATIRHVFRPTSTIGRRAFTSSGPRRATASRLVGDLERRISAIPLERFRNFCIVSVLRSLAACPLFFCHIMELVRAQVTFTFPQPRKNALITSSWNRSLTSIMAKVHSATGCSSSRAPLPREETSRSLTSSMSSENVVLLSKPRHAV